jgi:hypothetical protein
MESQMSTAMSGGVPGGGFHKDPHGIAPLTPEEIAADAVEGLPAMVAIKIAASVIGISVPTLRRWASRGRIRVGRTAKGQAAGRTLVPRLEIERIIATLVR